ncbi:DUF6935 domain-containing protein [Oribacterium sp. HCP28S3_H8]|uniref:DUF6935 domain-containing protein n=1 Tax=Oribacterium sp. HCP28S3_H8 TaxID=3438945 RepID=UPI003F8B3EA3
MKRVTVTMDKLPKSVLELKSEAEKMHSPEGTAILTIAAFCLYPENRDESLAMLDYLRGPRPLSIAEKQFIRDRFMDKDYVPRSYFKGATPDNDYTPDLPYELDVIDQELPEEDGYETRYLRSGGADSPRPIKFRNKPSTGEWFLWEQLLLAGIREPASKDPWR